MIFATVGAQLPFDRLIGTLDTWAGSHPECEVVAQIGPTDYVASHMQTLPFVPPDELRRYFERADAIVAHAGMGSIITALELGKPLLVMPRRGDLNETRNDHQVATARHFAEAGKVLAAFDEAELLAALDRIEDFEAPAVSSERASEPLLARLREFALGAKR